MADEATETAGVVGHPDAHPTVTLLSSTGITRMGTGRPAKQVDSSLLTYSSFLMPPTPMSQNLYFVFFNCLVGMYGR